MLVKEQRPDAKGLTMHVRHNSKDGPSVAEPGQALEQIQRQLTRQQQAWAEQLARDPAAFAQLEPQIHQAFGQLADQLAASLLGHAARQQALAAAAQKK